jgi:DNA-binding NtrC family response regulator
MSDPRSFAPDDELFQELLRRLDEHACLPDRLLEQLVVGSLPVAEADELRAHLRDCLYCLNTFSRLQSLHESSEPRARLVGDSPSARVLRAQLSRLADMDDGSGAAPPVLITGEIGTGKGVVAWEIHALSRRASRAFVEVECAAVPASRLELELFGCERGAIPDAPAATPGLFEAADGGTLFLDDVDALSLDLQRKLLAGIEESAVRRLGGVEARSLDIRVLVASHVDLHDAVRRGTFRADLLDRLALSVLPLPPLRERPDDIVPLARYFVGQFAQHHGGVRRLTTDAEERLRRYRWPGNVRELSHVIERAAMRRGREEIGAEELGLPA